ncbi:MAG: PIG-L deacetylase family protein [Kineosporiaceae bacterium]
MNSTIRHLHGHTTETVGRSTVVVLHAHPDDEAIFTGATIRALADAGHRVVLVTATTGGAGVPRVDLGGRTLQQQRVQELEAAADLLGVARLVVLGYGDSGAHRGPWNPGTLGAADAGTVAARLAHLIEAESADALVHYDSRGIYGHVDHVQVHRIGAAALERTGITGYEATVDTARLRSGPRHVLHGAAGDAEVGLPGRWIDLAVTATADQLAVKHAAMAAHASQIGPEWLAPASFAAAYATEWFVRRGPAGVLDRLVADTLTHQREVLHA